MPAPDSLDDLRVASPCPAKWEDMVGDDRSRACSLCELRVYDVSTLTRAEAFALVEEHEGRRLCLRLRRRADGRVMTADCRRPV